MAQPPESSAHSQNCPEGQRFSEVALLDRKSVPVGGVRRRKAEWPPAGARSEAEE
jgi:hypothetical protein